MVYIAPTGLWKNEVRISRVKDLLTINTLKDSHTGRLVGAHGRVPMTGPEVALPPEGFLVDHIGDPG